jgi:hypothetical protein
LLEVSFDIFLQRFDDAATDGSAVMSVLRPLIVDEDDEHRFRRIVTGDGDAEVYGDPASDLMFTHASGVEVWDVIVDVARAAGWVVMPVGCGTCVVDEAQRAGLPEFVPEPVVTVRSGAELIAAIKASD